MCRKLFSTKINSSLYLVRLTNTWTILLEKLLERMERKRCFDRWFEVFDSQYPRNSKGYDVTFVENCFSTKLAIGLGSINEHMDDLGWRRHEQLLRWNKDEGRRCWVPSFRFVSEGIGEASAKRRFDTVFGSQAMRSVLDDGFRPAKKFVGRFG